jgi:indole-3-glycerol phosphate synthase
VNFLSEIIAKKRQRIESAKQLVSLDQIRELAMEMRVGAAQHALVKTLRKEGINVIAEFKRKSPSKGVIREDADPAFIAKSYKEGGAIAMSVLTEEDFFDGSLEDLRAVKAVVDLPVLRKDFVFDEYQVYEAATAGAEAILLIVAAIEDALLVRLRQLAEDDLGLDALIEVHTSAEMQRAVACKANLIGVNNRDLRTFDVSLETSLRLAGEAPNDAVLISESGLHSNGDLRRLRSVGYHGFLIGESLMRTGEPAQALRLLIGEI